MCLLARVEPLQLRVRKVQLCLLRTGRCKREYVRSSPRSATATSQCPLSQRFRLSWMPGCRERAGTCCRAPHRTGYCGQGSWAPWLTRVDRLTSSPKRPSVKRHTVRVKRDGCTIPDPGPKESQGAWTTKCLLALHTFSRFRITYFVLCASTVLVFLLTVTEHRARYLLLQLQCLSLFFLRFHASLSSIYLSYNTQASSPSTPSQPGLACTPFSLLLTIAIRLRPSSFLGLRAHTATWLSPCYQRPAPTTKQSASPTSPKVDRIAAAGHYSHHLLHSPGTSCGPSYFHLAVFGPPLAFSSTARRTPIPRVWTIDRTASVLHDTTIAVGLVPGHTHRSHTQVARRTRTPVLCTLLRNLPTRSSSGGQDTHCLAVISRQQ